MSYSIPARVLTLPTTTQHEQDKTCSRDLVVMGSEDGCVCIWDLQSRELLSKNKTHQGSLPHMKQNPPTKSSSQVDTAFFETFCVESIIAISIHPTDPSIVAVAGLDRDPSIKICTLSPPPPTAT
ncbi:hypothetical protein VP01_3611g1 [Puccinia sorghi]|uniref:Uncharacterized protein n=1 Tax=Puccinia sorghi TaxID=27349 RepID=A0A0L6UV00_9BASI|nr:hypothetical protein VP01_3611g1 [Puccinia sorghi]